MWDLSNPTQILKLRMKHVRAGKMSQLICSDTHVLWVIGARGTPVPTGSTGPAPPLSLLPWFAGWRAICSCFFLPNFGLMTQIIKKLLLYFFESIAHPIIHACFPQHSILPSKYWLDRENGNNRRISFHSNNWTKHFCLKISISEKKKTYWKTYYGNINKMYLLEIYFLFEIFIEKCIFVTFSTLFGIILWWPLSMTDEGIQVKWICLNKKDRERHWPGSSIQIFLASDNLINSAFTFSARFLFFLFLTVCILLAGLGYLSHTHTHTNTHTHTHTHTFTQTHQH